MNDKPSLVLQATFVQPSGKRLIVRTTKSALIQSKAKFLWSFVMYTKAMWSLTKLFWRQVNTHE